MSKLKIIPSPVTTVVFKFSDKIARRRSYEFDATRYAISFQCNDEEFERIYSVMLPQTLPNGKEVLGFIGEFQNQMNKLISEQTEANKPVDGYLSQSGFAERNHIKEFLKNFEECIKSLPPNNVINFFSGYSVQLGELYSLHRFDIFKYLNAWWSYTDEIIDVNIYKISGEFGRCINEVDFERKFNSKIPKEKQAMPFFVGLRDYLNDKFKDENQNPIGWVIEGFYHHSDKLLESLQNVYSNWHTKKITSLVVDKSKIIDLCQKALTNLGGCPIGLPIDFYEFLHNANYRIFYNVLPDYAAIEY